jgi:hypothetical protein
MNSGKKLLLYVLARARRPDPARPNPLWPVRPNRAHPATTGMVAAAFLGVRATARRPCPAPIKPRPHRPRALAHRPAPRPVPRHRRAARHRPARRCPRFAGVKPRRRKPKPSRASRGCAAPPELLPVAGVAPEHRRRLGPPPADPIHHR